MIVIERVWQITWKRTDGGQRDKPAALPAGDRSGGERGGGRVKGKRVTVGRGCNGVAAAAAAAARARRAKQRVRAAREKYHVI